MTCIQESSLYGIVGQPLTQDYLARQLSIFQKKVPNSQPKPQFPTNAPPNLPLPPLYPGEIIQLQENRVVCTETFDEPAVGAVYITNHRIIFYGNFISDPESMEALHDANWKFQVKKESSNNSESTPFSAPSTKPGKYKPPFLPNKTEPSFKSFLVGGNQEAGPGEPSLPAISQTISHTQRIKTGFKKFGSLRLSPRNRGRRPSPKSQFSESTDGGTLLSPAEHLDVESRLLDGGISLPQQGTSAKIPTSQRVKRKDIIWNYNQDTVSLDSVSVNSTSEVSVTGTDDRSTCSPLGDGENSSLGTLDEVNDGRVCMRGGDEVLISAPGSFPGIDDSSGSSYRTFDSGIEGNFLSFTSIESYGGGGSEKLRYGKGSSQTHTTTTGNTVQVPASDRRKISVDFEKISESPTPEISESMAEKNLSKRVQLVWLNSVVQPESDSDSDSDNERRTTTAGKSGSETNNSIKRTSSNESSTLPGGEDVLGGIGSGKVENHTLPNKSDMRDNNLGSSGELSYQSHFTKPPPSHAGGVKKRTRKLKHAYTNVILNQGLHSSAEAGGGGGLKQHDAFPLKPVPPCRKRSKSSSPYIRKKPKPLPRKLPKREGASRSVKEEMFLSSLPADFKPLPLLGRTSESRANTQNGLPAQSGGTLEHGSSNHTAPQNGLPAQHGGTLEHGSSDHTAPQKELSTTIEHGAPSNHDAPPKGSSANGGATPDQRAASPTMSPAHDDSVSKQDPSTQGAPQHGESPNHAAPQCGGSPNHIAPQHGGSANHTASHQGSSTIAGPPHESCNPTSPFHCSSTSTYSSDLDSSLILSPTEGGAEDRTHPIPPPRRKRKSRLNSSSSGKDCVSPTSPLPFSPDESSLSRTFSLNLHYGGTRTDTNHGNPMYTDLSATKSRDVTDCGSGLSRDNANNNDDPLSSPFFEFRGGGSSGDGASGGGGNGGGSDNRVNPITSSNMDRTSQYSNDSARTSLTVFPGSVASSTGSHTMRPYSFISPNDSTSHQFNFTGTYEKLRESFSGFHSLPRSVGAATWTPRGHILPNRQSVKAPPIIPASTRYTLYHSFPLRSIHSIRKVAAVFLKEYNLKLSDGLLILCRNFQSMRLHIHPHNTYDSDSLKEILERKFLPKKHLHDLFAFQYRAAIRHPNPTFLQNRSLKNFFHLSDELSRLGLQDSKLWSVSRVLMSRSDLCPSYPTHVIVPICTGDLDFIRGAKQYHEGRFPNMTWYNQSNGAALLRAASTKDNRGQFGSNLQMDEALLQSISGSKLNTHGPPMTVHIYTEKHESGLKDRNAEQVRSYYYHNCKFHYSTERPPTFGSVRHSFNKLQAMLENNLSDEDYLIALDTTRWLPRIGELLSTAHSICNILVKEGAHVLVCYEAGWDRTTQLISLAQLLLDPYYRTIDGFQVLVQKEWVWFGHPFQLRHSRLGKSKEDGPVFLQWTDCVWQVMKQCPSAFEFNERFLMSMVEHSYSGIFGTFMTNNEGSRKQCLTEKGFEHMSVSSHTISFWTWVNVVNAAGRSFYNELYDPNVYKTVIEPSCSVPSLKLWSTHYCKHRPQKNTSIHLVLQTHLEELVRKKMRLEAIYAKLAPVSTTSSEEIKDVLPPPLGSRDELKIVRSTSDGVFSQVREKPKPVPPPKPLPKQYKYECIEEYLIQEGFDLSICKHLELGPTTCQGNLIKVGAVRKNWLQRWFVLDFNCQYLAYFENQTAYSNKETPKGVIPLGDITKVFQAVKKKEHLMKNIFLLETPHRTYQIQAPTITTMYIWIACLELPVSSLRLGAPTGV